MNEEKTRQRTEAQHDIGSKNLGGPLTLPVPYMKTCYNCSNA